MTASATADGLRFTAAAPVPLPRIPDALRSLWRQCCPEAGDVSRVLAANLVAVTDLAGEAEMATTLQRLLRRLPCRAFVLVLDPQAAAMQAAVQGAVRGNAKTPELVLEQITLRLAPRQLPNVPGVVRPLLVNDFRAHLWWGAAWPDAARSFDALHELVDHAVVDSQRFAMPALELEMVRVRQDKGWRITDLTWMRLSPWRRALAEAFERVAFRPGTPVQAVIRHGTGAEAQAAPLLLGRWLEQRLGASVSLEASGGPGALPTSIDLRLPDTMVQAVGGDDRIEVHVTTATSCWLPFAIASARGACGDLLAAAIDML